MEELLKIEPLIVFLLPGFLATWVFYTLTAHRKKKPFERIVEAVICTAVVQAILPVIQAVCFRVGDGLSLVGLGKWRCPWHDQYQPLRSAIVGITLGVLVAAVANNDMFHGFLRNRKWYLLCRFKDGESSRWQWTRKTSYPSEWYSAFKRLDCWVVLHLRDGRRLYGWAEEWPDSPEGGHFVISDAEWLVEDDENQPTQAYRSIPLPGVERILIAARSIKMIEFMKATRQNSSVQN